MIIIHQPSDLSSYLHHHNPNDSPIGFVPTMGALHAGHLALIAESKKHTSRTVCSIFVNPTQFNDPSDYNKYPNRLPEDIRMLEKAGTDILFYPPVEAIYPGGTAQLESYDLGYLETILEGEYRPGHFQGVCQVMSRLLDVVQPHWLFMGQKDYQQCKVIEHLLMLKGMRTRLVICPTQREADGLAMSSRNLRLNETQRQIAPVIYQALSGMKQEFRKGDIRSIKQRATATLLTAGFNVDYVEVARVHNLELINEWDGITPAVALAAAFLGDIRLIDNIILT